MLSSGASKFALFILAIELLLLGPVKGHAEPTTEPPLVSSSLFLLGDAPQAPAQKFSTFNTLSLTRLNVPSNNTGGWSIDTADRQLVRSFYNSVYQASEDTPIDWSGDQSTCSAGDTSNDFKNAVLARINFFRAMAGVPANITLNANY
ncbi:MAG: hypothetical protein HKP55_04935, partial [Gammaproteobacteria bacterium]|nr:hypothetical protein [Gammaproteobacteria bacterium]